MRSLSSQWRGIEILSSVGRNFIASAACRSSRGRHAADSNRFQIWQPSIAQQVPVNQECFM
jgi:hypothetical protein